jgi:flavin reductase (DIM6/NTAB) family NADH-FMN oxidoreductase RutF/DNA-binding MarR family transcriptional regulator
MDTAFDIKDFRRALGQFPTGVTVITTRDKGGDPIGVTASSFNSVSIDPPLVLWSVDKGAYSAGIFENSSHFAVNVLGKDQVATSNKFAGRGEDKFNGVAYQQTESGCALLENCAAQFECKTWNVYEGGDHLIIVGEVIDYRHEQLTSPLVFSSGSYAVSMQHPSSMKRDLVELNKDGFLSDYLPYLLHRAFNRSSNDLYSRLEQHAGVSPDEWRVLTLLMDNGATGMHDLAHMVMQPENIFQSTAEAMVSRGNVEVIDGDQLALTDAGRVVSNELFAIAREEEAAVLSVLSAEQAASLKDGLRKIHGNIV